MVRETALNCSVARLVSAAQKRYSNDMEKMKVWLAYFDVAYEGYFGMEVFSKEEDAKSYLDEHFDEYACWGDSVERVWVEMEVK